MEINKTNYEAYILDYYEGNLSAEKAAELMLFLEQNPSIKEEFEEFESDITITPHKGIQFTNKENLKKPVLTQVGNITSENYEEYIIADLENELYQEERSQLEQFIKTNPEAGKDYSLYKHTFLKPDKSIVFPSKKELKQPVPLFGSKQTRKRVYHSLAIAASLAILIGLFFFNHNKKATTSFYASRDKKPIELAKEVSSPQDKEAPKRKKVLKNRDELNRKSAREEITLKPTETLSAGKVFLASYEEKVVLKQSNYFQDKPIIFLDNDISEYLAESKVEDHTNGIEKVKNYFSVQLNNLFSPAQDKKKEAPKIDAWDIADIGVAGLNRISKEKFELKKERAKDGSVEAFKFSAFNFEYTRQKKNKDKK
jgi:hypothetical protein